MIFNHKENNGGLMLKFCLSKLYVYFSGAGYHSHEKAKEYRLLCSEACKEVISRCFTILIIL